MQCIYCQLEFDPSGEGDHVIPAAFGEFAGDLRFTRACPACHSEIDKNVEQLVRCGPESVIFRDYVAATSRRTRKRGNTRVASYGAKPPKSTTTVGEYPLELKRIDHPLLPNAVESHDSLVLKNEAGHKRPVRLFPNLTAAALRAKIEEHGPIAEAFLHCAEERWTRYIELLRETWHSLTIQELPSMDAGVHRVRGRLQFSVTDRYFRAIAKIAFHYFLLHSRRGYVGNERVFEEIRDFIKSGMGELRQFVREKAPMIDGPSWFHALAGNESGTDGAITVYVSLFGGPQSIQSAYVVRLGSLSNRLIVPEYVWAHRFVYDGEVSDRGRFVGRVEETQILRVPERLWMPASLFRS